MPIIETEADLLRLLDEDERFLTLVRNKILTKELLELPQRFAEYAAETDKKIAALIQNAEATNRRLDAIESDVSTLKSDVSTLKNDVGEVKGVSLENKLQNRGISLVATYFDLFDGTRIRVAERDDNSAEFNSAIYEAHSAGALNAEEYRRILDTDMVVRGRKVGAAHPVYVAIETSYSLSNADIDKVCQTAELIGKLFVDSEVSAALYYVTRNSELEAEAVRRSVTLMRTENLA